MTLSPQETEKLQTIVKSMGNDVEFPTAKRYLIKTLRANIPTGNNNNYGVEEVKAAARSMGYRHLDINHDKVGKRLAEPMNQTIGAQFDDSTNALWTLIRVADPVVQNMIESGQIRTASVETRYSCAPSEMGMGMCDVRHLYFTGLGLLTNDAVPGDSGTQIYGFESVQGQKTAIPDNVQSVDIATMIATAQAQTPGAPAENNIDNRKMPNRNPTPEPEQNTIMSSASQQNATTSTPSNPAAPAPTIQQQQQQPQQSVNNTPEPAPATTAAPSNANTNTGSNGTAGVASPYQQNNNASTAPSVSASAAATAAQTSPPSASGQYVAQQARAPGAEMVAQIPRTVPDGKGVASPQAEGSEMARFERIASMMRTGQNFGGMSSSRSGQEAVTADGNPNAIAKIWLPDLISLPVGLSANLRNTCRVETIERGADTAYFSTITIPEFVQRVLSTDENTEEVDQTHTITRIAATVKVKTSKNTVSYEAIQFIKGNVVQAIEQGFQEAAILSEDEEVLLALDAETASTYAAQIYGDGSVNAEGSVTSTMTFEEDRLLEAITEISAAKHMATNLTAVLHPRQAGALIKRQAYKDASISGDSGAFNRSGIFDVKYGIELRMSTKVSTGLGSPTTVTTYRAYVYKKNYAVGMAISRELDTEMLKTFKMSWILRAFHYIVAKVLVNKAVVKIVTA